MHDHVVVGGVQVPHELQRRHHSELVADAVLVEHPQVVQTEVGTDTHEILFERGIRIVASPVPREDPRHVRAVVHRRRDVVALPMRDAEQRRNDLPIERPSIREGLLQVPDLRLEPLFVRAACEPFAQARGLIRGRGIQEHVDLAEVERLHDPREVSARAAVLERFFHRLAIDTLPECRMFGVDAAVNHRPREMRGRDVEEAAGGVRLDSQGRSRDARSGHAIAAHRIDPLVLRDHVGVAHEIQECADDRGPVRVRRVRDVLPDRWRQRLARLREGERADDPDRPQQLGREPDCLLVLSPQSCEGRRVLRIANTGHKRGLQDAAPFASDSKLLAVLRPPIGHREHHAHEILEVQRGGDRGEIVGDAWKAG